MARWLIVLLVAVGLIVLVVVVGAVGLLATGSSGSGDSSGGSASSTAVQRDRAATVRFAGKRIDGVLYLLTGTDPNFADVYRVSGDPARARRLTTNGRLSAITAQPGRAVVADARGNGSDRTETLDLTATGDGLPGRLIDPAGQTPVLSRGSEIAYVVPRYGPTGSNAGTDLRVVPYAGGRPRVRYRARRRVDLGSPAWLPDNRLAVVRDPDTPKATLVLDPGTPRQRTADPGIPGFFNLEANADGDLLVANAHRFALLSPNGKPQGEPIDGQALAWADDGRRVLIANGPELGLLDPATGTMEELLHTDGPVIGSATWVNGQ